MRASSGGWKPRTQLRAGQHHHANLAVGKSAHVATVQTRFHHNLALIPPPYGRTLAPGPLGTPTTPPRSKTSTASRHSSRLIACSTCEVCPNQGGVYLSAVRISEALALECSRSGLLRLVLSFRS